MIKKLAWNTFKNTGDINSYLEFAELENLEKNIENNEKNINKKIKNKTERKHGNSKNKRHSNSRK